MRLIIRPVVHLLAASAAILLCQIGLAFASEIHEAAERGDLATVKNLLSQNPDLLEARDDGGHTPYLCAAAGGDLVTAQYLAEQGADTKALNSRGNNALALASYYGRPGMVEYLFGLGLDVNNTNILGFTPYLYAAYMNRPEIIRFLAAHGADRDVCEQRNGGGAIHWACARGDSSLCKLLMEYGADLRRPGCLDSTQPVMWASFAGNVSALKFLLDHGVDPNESKSNGWTALHNATMNNHLEAAGLLIEHGALIDPPNEFGVTPIMLAMQNGNIEQARFFLEHGADPKYVDSTSGNTLTHTAVLGNNRELLAVLLDLGAPIDVCNHQGDLPVQWAVSNGRVEAVEELMARGASPNSLDANGKSLLRIAIDQGQNGIMDLLLANGAVSTTHDSLYGLTELHAAAIAGNSYSVERVVNGGAEVNAHDARGHTPLHYAHQYGNEQAAYVLSEVGAVDDTKSDEVPGPRLSDPVESGDAIVWYLGHCGFAVKTSHHLLIFDYWSQGPGPDHPYLANGHIDPAEIASQDVTVFVTHEHSDHFDPAIFLWADAIPHVRYVYGFRPEDLPRYRESGYDGPAYTYLAARVDTSLDDMRITTVAANDAGVGFLVQVDGVAFYHAGDHAGWRAGQERGYKDEIDFLAGVAPSVDFSFLNVTGCHTGDTVALAEAVYYTLDKLHSAYWFPTHALHQEQIYRAFADKMAARGATSEAVGPEHRGDHYLLRKSQRM